MGVCVCGCVCVCGERTEQEKKKARRCSELGAFAYSNGENDAWGIELAVHKVI